MGSILSRDDYNVLRVCDDLQSQEPYLAQHFTRTHVGLEYICRSGKERRFGKVLPKGIAKIKINNKMIFYRFFSTVYIMCFIYQRIYYKKPKAFINNQEITYLSRIVVVSFLKIVLQQFSISTITKIRVLRYRASIFP